MTRLFALIGRFRKWLIDAGTVAETHRAGRDERRFDDRKGGEA